MVNTVLSQESRHCGTCGAKFTGRADKRFCSEKCRSIQSSIRRNESDGPIMDVIRILRHNRSVLKRLLRGKKTTVKREVLEAMGFNPKVISSLHVNGRNQTYYFCADYGFLPMNNNGSETALIVRREPYADPPDPWKVI